jgi:membrane protein required for colicin V production
MQTLLQSLNWVDYVLIAIFVLSVFAGLSRGLFKEIISLCTLVAAFAVATLFANQLAVAFASSSTVQSAVSSATAGSGVDASQPVSYIALGLSFGVLFVATVLVGAIIGAILNMIFQSTILGMGNRLLGGIFGFARGALICLVLIFLVQLTSFGSGNAWVQSQVVTAFQPAVQWVGSHVSPELDKLKEKFGEHQVTQ